MEQTVAKKVRGKVNHRQTYEYMMLAPVTGSKGWMVAFREVIVNAIDAGAKTIKIWFTSDKDKAIYFADDGVGLGAAGLDSAMSYGFSSRDRFDATTSGANGTGLKCLLGLGDFDKTSITIQTVSKELPRMTELLINRDYVVQLAEKQVTADEYTKKNLPIPRDWADRIERPLGTGTTVVFSGYDKRRIPGGPMNIIAELAEVLTPPAAQRVLIYHRGEWWPLEPVLHEGENYQEEFHTKMLGTVKFDLYLGGSSSSENLHICGPINMIQPYGDLVRKISKKLTETIPLSIAGVSGYIYIENANSWRVHDGTLNQDFHDSGADKEFVGLLRTIGEKISRQVDLLKHERAIANQKRFLRKIISINQEIFPIDQEQLEGSLVRQSGMPIGEPEALKKRSIDRKPVSISPKYVTLNIGEKRDIILEDRNFSEINLSRTIWDEDRKYLEIVGPRRGSTVTIKAREQTGETFLRLTNPDFPNGYHRIEVRIVKEVANKPVISGPDKIYPGSRSVYTLKNWNIDDEKGVSWSLRHLSDRSLSGVRLDDKKPKSVALTAADDCGVGNVVVVAKEGGTVLTQKQVQVVENLGTKPLFITINGKKYQVIIGTTFDVVATVRPDFSETRSPVRIIDFNPVMCILTSKGYPYDRILEAFARAALGRELKDGEIDYMTYLKKAEEFILEMKSRMFSSSE